MRITVRKKTTIILRELDNTEFNDVLKWVRKNDGRVIEYSLGKPGITITTLREDMLIITVPEPAQFLLEFG